jgi:phenylalanyl-tRNA synthetase beta chain
LGLLHPTLEKQLGFDTQVFLFELDQELLLKRQVPSFSALSRFPVVRRDLALSVKESVSADEITDCITRCREAAIKDIGIFDVYRGKGVEKGYKSVALSLILQNETQTLTDTEIDAIVNKVLEKLSNEINGKLRD